MKNILPEVLKSKFLEPLSELKNCSYEGGNPFLIQMGVNQYWIFLKNLSSAYMKASPDVTRVQLPHSARFVEIAKTDIVFLILGYDVDNDIMVCWNPNKVKDRLNAKSNVSLYSRASLQVDVPFNELKEGALSTGEKIILFKRTNLLDFFDKLSKLFVDDKTYIPRKHLLKPLPNGNLFEQMDTNEIESFTEKLMEITDKTLLDKIKPLLKKQKILAAAEICGKHYEYKYKNMKLKDWFQLIEKIK